MFAGTCHLGVVVRRAKLASAGSANPANRFLSWTLLLPAVTVAKCSIVCTSQTVRAGAANVEVRPLTPVVSRCSFLTSSSYCKPRERSPFGACAAVSAHDDHMRRSGQSANGKFTLTHDAHWASVLLTPGVYKFSLQSPQFARADHSGQSGKHSDRNRPA